MILTFGYPASEQRTGGVAAVYEIASAMARRGHEVHLIHGPAPAPSWFDFDPRICHHSVASLDDPSLPQGDVVFAVDVPARLGLPCPIVQGYRMLSPEMEHHVFRARAPKLCVARWLTGVGAALGVPPEQLWHVPCGIDHQTFRVRRPHDERTIDVAVLYHAHVSKGWRVAAAALDQLRRRLPDVRVTVFGMAPWEQEEVFGMPRPAEPVPDWATFVHAPTHEQLAREVYGRARVFVQSSDVEGFGLTAVEAMACGAALVTTDCGGSDDYAVDDETALVVPVGDAARLAAAVEALLVDEPRRRRLADAGSRDVRRLDWDVSAGTLEAHLERYLADPEAFQRAPAPMEEVTVP